MAMNYIFDIREKKKNVLRLLVTVLILSVIIDLVSSCSPDDLIPNRNPDFENLTIHNWSRDTLVFALMDNSDTVIVHPQSPAIIWGYGFSVIPHHEGRTIIGKEDLKHHRERLISDTLKVEVYNYSVTNTLSYDEFVEHINQYRITYKWFTWEQLRDKDWKLYYPVDFK